MPGPCVDTRHQPAPPKLPREGLLTRQVPGPCPEAGLVDSPCRRKPLPRLPCLGGVCGPLQSFWGLRLGPCQAGGPSVTPRMTSAAASPMDFCDRQGSVTAGVGSHVLVTTAAKCPTCTGLWLCAGHGAESFKVRVL